LSEGGYALLVENIIEVLKNGAEEQSGYCERETPIGNIILEVVRTAEGDERRIFKLDGKPIGRQKLLSLLEESGLQ
jgi:hypothetical protein